MKKITAIIVIIISIISCKKSKYDSDYLSFRFEGDKRCYLLHVPESYAEKTAVPLVIALHGGTGSGRNIEEQSGLAEFSDQKGFILASPNGIKRTWNAGWCCGGAERKNVNDVGFIDKMIDEIIAEYNIDEKRIYVTGMSNGAMMSYRIACELSDRIAAIAPVAGSMVTESCYIDNAISVIHFHSKKDGSVPYKGGVGDGISDHYNTPLDSVANVISSYVNCTYDTTYTTTEDIEVWQWLNGADSSEVVYYLTPDGGHSWPGGIGPRRNSDQPSNLIDANEVMWEFFMRHPKK